LTHSAHTDPKRAERLLVFANVTLERKYPDD
jgi:hypothetical protein